MTQEVRTSANTRMLQYKTDATGFSAVFAVHTPVTDASGVAHVVEHLVFRSSALYPEAHNLFAALALLPLKINATTLAGVTYYFIETEHESLFYQALVFLYAGLIQPAYRSDDIRREKDGVIFQELAFREKQPAYEKHLNDLTTQGRSAEAVAGGFSGGLASLTEREINTYKANWYTPDRITLLISGGNTEHIATLLDITAAQVLPPMHSAGISAGKSVTPDDEADSSDYQHPQPALPEDNKMLSRGIAALIRHYVSNTISPTATTSLPPEDRTDKTEISVPFHWLNHCRDPLFPPVTTNNQASFVREVKAAGHFPFNTLPPLPKYVQGCWDQFHPFLPVRNKHDDWYFAFPFSDKILPRLEQLLMKEKFWSPRISGDCYSQGIGLHGNSVVIYVINDAAAGDRKAFCEQIRVQLFDV